MSVIVFVGYYKILSRNQVDTTPSSARATQLDIERRFPHERMSLVSLTENENKVNKLNYCYIHEDNVDGRSHM